MVDSVSTKPAVPQKQVEVEEDNKHKNTGKIVGAGIGAAWGGYSVYKTEKINSTYDEFLASKEVQDALNKKSISKLKELYEKSSTLHKAVKKKATAFIERNKGNSERIIQGIKQDVENLKGFKKLRGITYPATFAILTGICLGIGAIVDAVRSDD